MRNDRQRVGGVAHVHGDDMRLRSGEDEDGSNGPGSMGDVVQLVRSATSGVEDRPALVGITGGVGVGKSVLAAQLAASLREGGHEPDRSERPAVEIVSTDGFLLTNAELAARGTLERKGFPETYDHDARFPLEVPTYSHVRYDRLPGVTHRIGGADVVILEGLTLLQDVVVVPGEPTRSLRDLLDLSIYIDAPDQATRRWWVERFLRMRDELSGDPDSFLHAYADVSDAEAEAMGDWVWDNVNGPNLDRHIRISEERADVVIRKAGDHRIAGVEIRSRPAG
jgi:type I pantothenate kinase